MLVSDADSGCAGWAGGAAVRETDGSGDKGAVRVNEAHVTVVGNAATQVDFRTSAAGVPVARFRLASTVRRYDQQRGGWSDAYTSFYTVWAWRALAANVASSVTVGEPVVVTGQLRIQQGEREGKHYVSADVMASAIGHDISRGTSAFARVSTARPGLVDVVGAGADGTAGAAGTAGVPGRQDAP